MHYPKRNLKISKELCFLCLFILSLSFGFLFLILRVAIHLILLWHRSTREEINAEKNEEK